MDEVLWLLLFVIWEYNSSSTAKKFSSKKKHDFFTCMNVSEDEDEYEAANETEDELDGGQKEVEPNGQSAGSHHHWVVIFLITIWMTCFFPGSQPFQKAKFSVWKDFWNRYYFAQPRLPNTTRVYFYYSQPFSALFRISSSDIFFLFRGWGLQSFVSTVTPNACTHKLSVCGLCVSAYTSWLLLLPSFSASWLAFALSGARRA